jgi:hypothetical protein
MSTSTNKSAPTINLKVNAPPVFMKYTQADAIKESPAIAKEKKDDVPF